MRYCSSSRQDFSLMDEVRFTLSNINSALLHLDKTIILEIHSLLDLERAHLDFETLEELCKENRNIILDFFDINDLREAHEFSAKWRLMYHYPVTSYNMIELLEHYNVCALIMGEPLVFNLRDARKRLPKAEIHVCPHAARTILQQDIPGSGLNHFWITPQHIDLYEDYVDVLEIVDDNEERERMLLEIYTGHREYLLGLSYLISGLDTNIIVPYVDKDWATKRLTCGQICQINKNRCHRCDLENTTYDLINGRGVKTDAPIS